MLMRDWTHHAEGSLKEGVEMEDASQQQAHLTIRKTTCGSPPRVSGCAHSGLSSHLLAQDQT